MGRAAAHRGRCGRHPFADDLDREVALLERTLDAGAEFVQSQMTFDPSVLSTLFERAAGVLDNGRFYAGLALLRNERIADRARRLPGCVLPDVAHRRIALRDGLNLAAELATEPASIPAADALHIYPLGAEAATRELAAAFRTARGMPARRHEARRSRCSSNSQLSFVTRGALAPAAPRVTRHAARSHARSLGLTRGRRA